MKNHGIVCLLSVFFSNKAFLQLSLFLFLFFSGWIIENIVSHSLRNGKWGHAFLNFKFFIIGAIPQVILGLFFIKIIHWTQRHYFGLFFLLPQEKSYRALAFVIVFLSLDFGAYIYHIVMHKVSFFWSFHAIHHSDERVDISTVFREHPAESIIRNSFAMLWVFLSGSNYPIFFIHLLMQTFFVLFTHANIRLPKILDKTIGLIFITPSAHQVHHHFKQPFTDRNYGDILCIWDRLLGTFIRLPFDRLKFGLDSLPEGGFRKLLIHPFVRNKS